MNTVEIFKKFAADFEFAVGDGNWQRLKPYFAPDAVYANAGIEGPKYIGPDEICSYFKRDIDSFDSRFDTREVASLKEISTEGERLIRVWRATYRREGLPDLILEGESRYLFKDGIIQTLECELKDAFKPVLEKWMNDYGKKL